MTELINPTACRGRQNCLNRGRLDGTINRHGRHFGALRFGALRLVELGGDFAGERATFFFGSGSARAVIRSTSLSRSGTSISDVSK